MGKVLAATAGVSASPKTVPNGSSVILDGQSARWSVQVDTLSTQLAQDLVLIQSPTEASFLTQIILNDLRPALCPSKEAHYTAAPKRQKSNSITYLNMADAMGVWGPILSVFSRWQVVPGFEVALSNDHDLMYVRNPLRVWVSELSTSWLRKLNKPVVIWTFCTPLDFKDRQGYRVHSSAEASLKLTIRLGRNQVRRRTDSCRGRSGDGISGAQDARGNQQTTSISTRASQSGSALTHPNNSDKIAAYHGADKYYSSWPSSSATPPQLRTE